MRLHDLFPHVKSVHLCGKSQNLYVVVAPDVAADLELRAFLEQNYPRGYDVVPEDSRDTIPSSTTLVASLSFNGSRKFLEELYEKCSRGNPHANTFLLSELEDCMSRGCFGKVDTLLKMLDVTRVTHAVLLSAVSFTYHGKKSLVCRDSFIARAEAEIENKLGVEHTEELFRGRR